MLRGRRFPRSLLARLGMAVKSAGCAETVHAERMGGSGALYYRELPLDLIHGDHHSPLAHSLPRRGWAALSGLAAF